MKKAGTTGLVVCGGLSTRMKTDKGMLHYHGQPQWQYMAALLTPHCNNVYLSVNDQQQDHYRECCLPLLTDLAGYKEGGPMAALLTAGHYLPGQDFLVLGCDYPLLHEEELRAFVQSIAPAAFAKAFYNTIAGVYEPLLAYYTAAAVQDMTQRDSQYRYSLQQFLRSCEAGKYIPRDSDTLCSADDPEAAASIREKISTGKALHS
jgi:molybdopterin-guanine dinucleotide biosynthesis protein A